MIGSYYEATVERGPVRPSLKGTMHADVAIIGAGYTGLSAALTLAERGYAVRVLEAERVCSGASGRNGGQLGSGQRRSQKDLEAMYGAAHAHALWQIGQDAKAEARARIARFGIACDLKAGLLHTAHRERHVSTLVQDAERLRTRYDYDQITVLSRAEVADRLGTPIYFGGTLDRGAGHLHPLAYGLGLARAAEGAGAVIHEKTRVLRVDEPTGRVTTSEGEVSANHILLACNGYLGRLMPAVAPYILPINAYIGATAPLGPQAAHIMKDNVAVADTRFVVNYYRLTADHRLVFGGGESFLMRARKNADPIVRPHLARVFPVLAAAPLDYAWSGAVAVTPTRLPHFGRLGTKLYFAQGFSGHGVALAGLAGSMMADALAGTAERFDVMARLNVPKFPGGALLRGQLLVLAMIYGRLRDLV